MTYFNNAMEDQYVKGDFKSIVALFNPSNPGGGWQVQGDIPDGNFTFTDVTDLPGAKVAAAAHVQGLGYLQITYWVDTAPQNSTSVWFKSV